MGSENLAYALTQVVHNFGAAVVLGGAIFALWPTLRIEFARAFVRLVCIAWGVQISSGIVFGLVSFHYYGETPDLSGVAIAALAVKAATAIGGFLLAAGYLMHGRNWSRLRVKHTFHGLAALAATALTAAAFLRWFS